MITMGSPTILRVASRVRRIPMIPMTRSVLE